MDVRENNPTAHSSREYLSETYPVLNVTRQEVTFLANFLGRIPGDFLTGGGTEPNQALSLAIVDNVMDTAPQTTSSQEDQPGTSLGRARTRTLDQWEKKKTSLFINGQHA